MNPAAPTGNIIINPVPTDGNEADDETDPEEEVKIL